MILPCAQGDFVECYFPFAEYPASPGPVRHIAYVSRIVRMRSGEIRALVMLTTTSARMIRAIPQGLSVSVTEPNSRRMGMRNSFTIDIHRLALLPFSQAWFPDLKSENFVIGRADDHLREAITRRYDDMLRRYPNPALMFGPGA